jgi:ComF family protein
MRERLRMWMHHWPRWLGQALLPCVCALCGGAAQAVLCAPCQRQFVMPNACRCPCCANPLAATDVAFGCAGCLAQPPAFDATLAAVDYAAPLDRLVLQLKFGAGLALAPWFAAMLRDTVLAHPDFLLPNILCPVPLGPNRLRERGFNQALEIARPLARALGIELQSRWLVRARETSAQSTLAPGARRDNIKHAFAVAPEAVALVRGQHIGLVDDVMTSGHTLGEVAATLKRFGAARVSNLVFARTPPR